MKLDRVANVAVLVVCLAVAGEIALNLRQRHPSSRSIRGYKAGDVVKETSALGLSQASQTLMLVTASTCHFCTESMPFYRKIVDESRNKHTRVIAVTME